ncbi:MAG: glycoside hydrolase [Planctomycetota bacterium]|jgi:hypothetical protein
MTTPEASRAFRKAAGTACVALVLLACSSAASAEIARTDKTGRLQALVVDGAGVPVFSDVIVPAAGWKRLPGLGDAKGLRSSRVGGPGGARRWQGRIEPEPGKPFFIEQMLSEKGGAATLHVKVTAEADVATVGVVLRLGFPVATFAGGECVLEGADSGSATLPKEKPAKIRFLGGRAGRMTIADAEGENRLIIVFDRTLSVQVQDNREWGGSDYGVLVTISAPLANGESASARVTFRYERGEPLPVALAVDADRVRYRLDGFGGNYCFNIESPVTRYTLDNLRVAWARTEMTLVEWEPENDNDDPRDTDMGALAARDRPGSNLRRELLLAKDIQRRGIPYAIAIWPIPEWLCAEPGKGPRATRRRVAPGKWPELLECIGSYLVYAKRQYGVEPDLLSFNEANIGIRVLFTAEEHRDAIKRIGAHLEGLGLKTKMLLADATGPRGTHKYAEPAAGDPEAMRYVGAVGFHSWGGATPEQYAAWGDLAERLGVPLLVAELGVDAFAWRGKAYDSFDYGLREVRQYQEILLYARPQGTMQWEFTSDYGLARVTKRPGGGDLVEPTWRFWFVKHFADLTPPKADALGVSSDHRQVLVTAFAAGRGARRKYTIHVANLGGRRPATLSGIPPGLASLRAVRTGEEESFRELPEVRPRGGRLELDLAPRSLLTLTNMPR